MSAEPLRGKSVARFIIVALLAALLMAACGPSDSSANDSGKQQVSGTRGQGAPEAASSGKGVAQETTAGNSASGEEAELARAEVEEREITNMIPADGKKPDAARPLPKNPPDGIEVYPATTNRSIEGSIHYERRPPTNGDHAPLWQNCGFYEKPIEERHAVHSLDHGVVWITYRPDLPKQQVEALRPYGRENYVIVSPYPGQDAPVIATSWRVQLELNGADDPRLRRFVDEFRISEIAPLSGNRCVGGVGRPAA